MTPISELIRMISENTPTLNESDFCNRNITYDDARQIAKALTTNNKLSSIDLENSQIPILGVEALIRASSTIFSSRKTIKNFAHINKDIDEGEIEILARILHTIRDINLTGCSINDEMIETLAHIIHPRNIVTETIDLSNNNLTDNSAPAIITIIKSNHNLHDINLKNNQLGDQGISLLADFLAQHNYTGKINIADNNISSQGIKYLQQTLQTQNIALEAKEQLADNNSNNTARTIETEKLHIIVTTTATKLREQQTSPSPDKRKKNQIADYFTSQENIKQNKSKTCLIS